METETTPKNGRYPKSLMSRKNLIQQKIMSTQETAETHVLGGWSPYNSLTPRDQEVFNEAMKGFVGVRYSPQSVSTQVVAGTNYRFKCQASMPPSEAVWEAIVEIFQPLDGRAHVVGIIRL